MSHLSRMENLETPNSHGATPCFCGKMSTSGHPLCQTLTHLHLNPPTRESLWYAVSLEVLCMAPVTCFSRRSMASKVWFQAQGQCEPISGSAKKRKPETYHLGLVPAPPISDNMVRRWSDLSCVWHDFLQIANLTGARCVARIIPNMFVYQKNICSMK